MEPAHIALIIIGAISCTEAAWGIRAPRNLQAAVRALADDLPDRNLFTGFLFAGLATALLILMTSQQRPSDWALLVLSWIFYGGAYVNFKAGAFRTVTRVLILNRSPAVLRSFYVVEMVVALGLIFIGLLHW